MNSTVTIELSCLSGAAVVYVGEGFVPHSLQFDYQARCDSSAASPSCQLSLRARSEDPIVLAIHSTGGESGGDYTLWKFSTTDRLPVEALDGTDKVIRKLNLLSGASEDDLHIRFPKLDREATIQVQKERDRRGEKTASRYHWDAPLRSRSTVSDDPSDSSVLEGAIMDIGRRAIAGDGFQTRRGKNVDPNSHYDMFPKIKILKDFNMDMHSKILK